MAILSLSTKLLCPLFFIYAHVSASKDQETIPVESGQDITLTCRAQDKDIIVVDWSRADLEPDCVLLYRDGHFVPDEQHPSFKNRVDLQDRQMKDGDVSLILKDVTINDTGTYECRVVQRGPKRRKRAHLKTHPIRIIYLHVDPPGQPGGATEDGSVGPIVALSVSAVLFAAAVLLLIHRKYKQRASH